MKNITESCYKKDSKLYLKPAMFSLSNVPLNLIGGDVTLLQRNKTAERGQDPHVWLQFNQQAHIQAHTHLHAPPFVTVNPGTLNTGR